MQSEQSIQKSILKLLSAREDVWAVKTITTNRNGTPDIVACVGGRFVAIEVKTAKGVVAPLQHHQIDLINSTGGVAMIARSTKEVKDMLDKMYLQDGQFENMTDVDPDVKAELIDMRERLENVADCLSPLLMADDITKDDIERALDALKRS